MSYLIPGVMALVLGIVNLLVARTIPKGFIKRRLLRIGWFEIIIGVAVTIRGVRTLFHPGP